MVEKIIQDVIDMYYRYYPDAQKIPVNVILTDNLNLSHGEIRPDIKEYLFSVRPQNDFNGRMVLPVTLDKPMYILINKSKMKEYAASGTWIGTIAHELTHAIDFYCMARLENLDNYNELEKSCKYNVFRLWSEYNARKKGYKFLRYIMSENLGTPEEQIKDILQRELPGQKQIFLSLYNDNYSNEYDQIYHVMNYLGRYSVWCDLFPDIFSEEFLATDMNDFSWPKPLLSFLRSHESLENMYENFGQLDDLLWKYWINY